MVRKLGQSRAGTGKVTTENTDKWAGAVVNQLASSENIKDIVVKTINPLSIKTDQDNPRKLAINAELIKQIAEKFSINQFLLAKDNDWIDDYIQNVADEFNLKGKQIGDLRSITEFASALKSADRLIHPIAVWKNETSFHLISGERRLLAHILMRAPHISSRIISNKPTQQELDMLQWEENVHREDMTLFEYLTRLNKLINAHGTLASSSVRSVAKLAGISKTNAQRYLVILKYPSAILMDAIERNEIVSLVQAAKLAQLTPTELEHKLNGIVVNKPQLKPAIKLDKTANPVAVKKVIDVLAKEFDAQDSIQGIDLNKAKGLATALNNILFHIESSEA